MDENVFLFTFLQALGKKKALDSGPWMLNNDLVVVVDFDPNKALEEYVFNRVPIWVHVLKLPLGRMDRATREMIGEKVGDFVDVEVGADGLAVGESLRIKVKLDITKPLMRGTVIQIGDDERVRWSPFQYEYLPKLCYIRGVIGHEEKKMLHQFGKEGREAIQ
ncbi:putative reverse transcriptase [Hordeum vulgare]|nr:putative reverse transcriptase [Hordeum vulgare]